MSFKNSLKYFFIGVSVFSFSAVKADSAIWEQESLAKAFEAKHSQSSCSSHRPHRPNLRDIIDLFFLADFRFTSSQFVASSAERTFDVWGGAPSTSQTVSNEVLAGFTVANALAAAQASNEVLSCNDLADLIAAWTAFALADVAQTNEPTLERTIDLVAAAAAVGRLYDECVQIDDNRFIGRIRSKLSSITSNFSPSLKQGEFFQKVQTVIEEERDDVPLFEILFGLYGLARSGTNYTASVAHGVADVDPAAAAIIYVDSQILSEASFLIMDIITLTVTLIDFIEHHTPHHKHHHR